MKRTNSSLLLAVLLILAFPLTSRGATRVDLAAMWLAGDDPVTPTAGADEQAPYIDRDIRVQVWHDKDDEDTYRRGEPMQVHFRTNSDLYVVVYRVDTDGYVNVLWPTSRFDDGFVYGGHTYTLPATDQRLYASQSKGVEYLQAIASRYPFDLRELGIDFAFDHAAAERYDYAVAGDPFLAVNDINYAITGLEEDVDYIVTDWSHLYVEQKVEYARYTCQQCHTEQEEYHPYVDTCTQVSIYYDYGWHDRWYVRFGYYPLYYEPPYYYWDLVSYRPYWFWYYPVNYYWSCYPVYYRPYPIYAWNLAPQYRGDYLVRYRRGDGRAHPLYDIASPSTDRRIRDARSTRSAEPASVVRVNENDTRRVRETDLVRNDIPSRTREGMTTLDRGARADRDARGDRGPIRSGVRTDVAPRDRSIVSQTPPRAAERTGVDRQGIAPGRDRAGVDRTPDRSGSTERRWTRPVVRNVERGSAAQRDRSESDGRRIQREPVRDAPPERVHRSVTPQRRDENPPQAPSRIERRRGDDRQPTSRPPASTQPAPRRDSRGSGTVKRDTRDSQGSGSGGGGVSESRRESSRGAGSVSPSRPAPSSRQSSGSTARSRGSSSGRGESARSGSQGGGGGASRSSGSRSRGSGRG